MASSLLFSGFSHLVLSVPTEAVLDLFPEKLVLHIAQLKYCYQVFAYLNVSFQSRMVFCVLDQHVSFVNEHWPES